MTNPASGIALYGQYSQRTSSTASTAVSWISSPLPSARQDNAIYPGHRRPRSTSMRRSDLRGHEDRHRLQQQEARTRRFQYTMSAAAECEDGTGRAFQKVVEIEALGDLTAAEFEQYRDAPSQVRVCRKRRARHAVYENQRTEQGGSRHCRSRTMSR